MNESKPLKAGDRAILEEGDWCDSKTQVVIVKIHKGGNAIVMDGDTRREVGVKYLTPVSKNP